MLNRSSVGPVVIALASALTIGGVRAADDARYPNWKGQWEAINPRLGGQAIKYDPTKAWGPAQQAPLTPEYQKVLEASMADQTRGGIGNYPSAGWGTGGMRRIMAACAHAAHDGCSRARVLGDARDHLHPHRHRAAARFYRRTRLAERCTADLSG